MLPWLIGGLVVAGGLLATGAAIVARRSGSAPPIYHQVTFRRGLVAGARFAPDGQTIVYSAAWERPPVQILSTRIGSSDTSTLPVPSASLLSISNTGKMAIRLPRGNPFTGTLAEVSLGGQAPRELVNDVFDADWAPSGDALAITHFMNRRVQLEYPSGTVLHSAGLMRSPRFSPRGDLIAFIEYDVEGAGGSTAPEGTRLSVVDLKGRVKVITKGWGEMVTLAWNPRGDEIWFSARELESRSGGLALHAVTLSGVHRLVASLPGIVLLQQIFPDGRVLLSHEQWPVTMVCLAPGTNSERDVSWLDYSKARDMSADGRLVLFDENGLAEGANARALRPRGPVPSDVQPRTHGRWPIVLLFVRPPIGHLVRRERVEVIGAKGSASPVQEPASLRSEVRSRASVRLGRRNCARSPERTDQRRRNNV